MKSVDLAGEFLEVYSHRNEDHFFDRKSSAIKPSKLSRSFSAFANADGGELIVGIEDDGESRGFDNEEAANDVLSCASSLMRSEYYSVEFVRFPAGGGGVLFRIDRHPVVVHCSQGDVYVREGAQNRRIGGDKLEALKRAKGESRYELTLTTCPVEQLENSEVMIKFMTEGSVFAEPDEFLQKNLLVKEGLGTIASTMLFSDMPQAHLPSSGLKLYRYKTSGEAARAHLARLPETIEGPVVEIIDSSRRRVEEIVSNIPKLDSTGFQEVRYPSEALHEILVNALLHRDYGIRDYVHVRIFDNRIEVESPGRLHGAVTVQNILDERSARNPQIQRVLNRFPDPPNQDIGEGLNTAFRAMEDLRLSLPVIEELSDRVRVTIKHEQLASPERSIMDRAKEQGSINNSEAREITNIPQERTIRRIFEQLTASDQLEKRGSGRGTRYFPISVVHENDEH